MAKQEQRYYSPQEFEKMTVEAERLNQRYPYTESDIQETWEDMQIERAHQETVLARYRNKNEKKRLKIESQKNSENLVSLFKKDLRKLGRGLIITSKFISYLTLGHLGIPTATRIITQDLWDVTGTVFYMYGTFDAIAYFVGSGALNNGTFPKWMPYVLGAQVATNLASGVYEYIRSLKKRAEEESSKKSLEKISEA